MEYFVIAASILNLLCIWFYLHSTSVANKRLDLALDKYWGDARYDKLTSEVKDTINKTIIILLADNQKEILENYKQVLYEKLDESDYISGSITSALNNASMELVETASKQYVDKHLPEIISKLDVQSVSNAMLLRMTGQIMGNITESPNQIESNAYVYDSNGNRRY